MPGSFPTEHHKRFKIRKARFCLGKNEKRDSLHIKISRQLGQANQKIIMMKNTLRTGKVISLTSIFTHPHTVLQGLQGVPLDLSLVCPLPPLPAPACLSISVTAPMAVPLKEASISLFLHKVHLSCLVLSISTDISGTKK